MKQPGLDNRHRNENREVSRKCANTLTGALRKIFGEGFAPGCSDCEKLSEALNYLQER